MSPVLETRALYKSFGALKVAQEINFTLQAGARHALIGPNGAGKTTLVNMLMGGLPPSSGSILLSGEDVTRQSQRQRVMRGLARTYQINSLFRTLLVLDNVALAVAERHGVGWGLFRAASRYRAVIEESMQVLESLGLADDAKQPLMSMPYGKQRLVEIAIALAMRPKVLLMDEPAAGIPSLESHRVLEVLGSLPAEIAILIIEHDMELVFRFARRITVLAQGAVLMEGDPGEVSRDARVRQVYLGERHG
jgi:branched-chain amino acid transport system ATP-binding protein